MAEADKPAQRGGHKQDNSGEQNRLLSRGEAGLQKGGRGAGCEVRDKAHVNERKGEPEYKRSIQHTSPSDEGEAEGGGEELEAWDSEVVERSKQTRGSEQEVLLSYLLIS